MWVLALILVAVTLKAVSDLIINSTDGFEAVVRNSSLGRLDLAKQRCGSSLVS